MKKEDFINDYKEYYGSITNYDLEMWEYNQKQLSWMRQKLLNKEDFYNECIEVFFKNIPIDIHIKSFLGMYWSTKKYYNMADLRINDYDKFLLDIRTVLGVDDNKKILPQLDYLLNNSGDKVKLKKEIQELKQENELLKKMLRGEK